MNYVDDIVLFNGEYPPIPAAILQPAHPRAVDVLRTDVVRDVVTHLMPQRREIGADLNAPVGVTAIYPRIATDVEVLACVLTAAIVADNDLRAGYVPGVETTGTPAVNDLLPRGVEVLAPRCGIGCCGAGARAQGEQEQGGKASLSHESYGSHCGNNRQETVS